MMKRGQLKDKDVWGFMMAGKSLFTVLSPLGEHRTFKVLKVHDVQYPKPIWTVMGLVGPDNHSHYRNLGYLKETTLVENGKSQTEFFFVPNKGLANDHYLIKAFLWVFRRAIKKDFKTPQGPAIVYHEGRCGRCGRRLTNPISIEMGLGPKCAIESLFF